MSERLRLGVIIGSVRKGRSGTIVADWFAAEARKSDQFEVELIDLADFHLPLPFGEGMTAEELAQIRPLTQALHEADAYVVVTPEYNHSYPAGLKNAIDWHGKEWEAKPVAFVSYGGISGGLRAVEHLRTVLAELHAVTIRATVSFVNYWDQFDGEGRWPKEPETGNSAAKGLLQQLAWWAQALKEAKAKEPYPG
ncbi:NADPH-dependent FMN reductase [Streptosporangium sp. NPDC001559]|uniref:NADPH-dependent FMN reductase n=1 Tax=Streptosporangium sp. NPDC001559 TaxID=3366187 RepID=UPI0036E03F28